MVETPRLGFGVNPGFTPIAKFVRRQHMKNRINFALSELNRAFALTRILKNGVERGPYHGRASEISKRTIERAFYNISNILHEANLIPNLIQNILEDPEEDGERLLAYLNAMGKKITETTTMLMESQERIPELVISDEVFRLSGMLIDANTQVTELAHKLEDEIETRKGHRPLPLSTAGR